MEGSNGRFFGMTQEEKEALNKEIKEVTDTNCSHDIKDIADMLADTTEKFCKDYPFY